MAIVLIFNDIQIEAKIELLTFRTNYNLRLDN